MTIVALAVAALLSGPDEPPPLALRPARPVVVRHYFDGDTVMVDVVGLATTRGGRVYHELRSEDVRVAGYDAPERHQPGGPEATAALESLLGSGRVWARWTGKETLGRLACELYVETPSGFVVDVAHAMRSLGHHLPRGQRPPPHTTTPERPQAED